MPRALEAVGESAGMPALSRTSRLLLLGAAVPLDYFILPLIALGFGWGLPLGLIDGEALVMPTSRQAA